MPAGIPVLGAPDSLALLSRLEPFVDDEMLREIAAADYGNDAPAHYAWLRQMKDEGIVPEATWIPMEVLELMRWSQPDEPGWRPGNEGTRGHILRAYCCAWILRVAGERPEYGMAAGMDTSIQLVGSLDRLETSLWLEASDLMDWFRPRWSLAGQDQEDAMLGVVQLYCCLRSGYSEDARLIALCEWIAARADARETSWSFDKHAGLSVSADTFNRKVWLTLGAKLAALDLQSRDPALRDWVRLIGGSLAEA